MESLYRRRVIDAILDDLMAESPAIALAGPKAVGKTATCQQRAATVFRLDGPLAREAFINADRPLDTAQAPILLDEWQYVPDVWNQVRRAVDDGAEPGRFLLAGSAAPMGAAIHSGAGRILPIRMRPLSLFERGLAEPTVSLRAALADEIDEVAGSTSVGFEGYVAQIVASGFPGMRSYSPRLRNRQLDAYIDNIVNREFAEQGLAVRRPDTVRRWMRAYAAATGTTANYTQILNAATPGESEKPAAKTTIAYRDVLQSLWILDDVRPWDPTGSSITRLSQTPKHFLADPALAARLLLLDEAALTSGAAEPDFGPSYGSIAGRLFEALVALSLQTYASAADAHVSYLRTRNGDHEVDFIVQAGQSIVAIEVKLSPTVTDSDVRHLVWLKDRLGPRLTTMIIVTTGPHAYRRVRDGVIVTPAALLGP
jgi:predicted AAA+ superfamily ATPase